MFRALIAILAAAPLFAETRAPASEAEARLSLAPPHRPAVAVLDDAAGAAASHGDRRVALRFRS